MKKIFFFIIAGFALCADVRAAEMTIVIDEDDQALVDYTDELGWREDMGISRRAFAKDQVLSGIIKTIANHRAVRRKHEEMLRIEEEETQRAAMELAPRVTIKTE